MRYRLKAGRKDILTLLHCVYIAALFFGCSDPMTLGRFQSTPVTNIILDSLGAVEEEPERFSGAREPESRDLIVSEREYVIRPGDQVEITIMDLFRTGFEWAVRRQVSETGRVTLPEIGTFRVSGRTESELTEDIKDLLSPQILRDPKVSVVVILPTEKVFSIYGVLASPGQYPLQKPDFRIFDALSIAGGRPQTAVDFAYVIRKVRQEELGSWGDVTGSGRGEEQIQEEGLGILPGPSERRQEYERTKGKEDLFRQEGKIREQKPATPEEEREMLLESIRPLCEIISPVEMAGSAADEYSQRETEVVFPGEFQPEEKPLKVIREFNKFKLVPGEGEQELGVPERIIPPEHEYEREEASLGAVKGVGQYQEVIRVDLKALENGDVNQNIVIRSGDNIIVPLNDMGVFYIKGQVAGPGAYQLDGDRMTLKEAIAAAGSLTGLANPSRCDITRRIGRDKEVICRVNLQKLLEGSQPNYFIKPHDIIDVGSHPVMRWIAVVRQSFRSTYGFGFVYDRNLADKDFGN